MGHQAIGLICRILAVILGLSTPQTRCPALPAQKPLSMRPGSRSDPHRRQSMLQSRPTLSRTAYLSAVQVTNAAPSQRLAAE